MPLATFAQAYSWLICDAMFALTLCLHASCHFGASPLMANLWCYICFDSVLTCLLPLPCKPTHALQCYSFFADACLECSGSSLVQSVKVLSTRRKGRRMKQWKPLCRPLPRSRRVSHVCARVSAEPLWLCYVLAYLKGLITCEALLN